MNIGILIEKLKRLPEEAQRAFLKLFRISEKSNGCSVGAIIVCMHLLELLGVPRYLDDVLGEKHTSIDKLKTMYRNSKGKINRTPPIPSSGIILCLLISDMIAHPSEIVRIYKVAERAVKWKTDAFLGICPGVLTDDRILKIFSSLGKDPEAMKDVLYLLTMHVSEKFGVPLNRFFLDTTLLQLDGKFDKALKVVPGRGKDTFSQLIISLAVAADSSIPVAFSVWAGNTFDGNTLPDALDAISRVAPPGPIELVMDRIYPTGKNISYLNSCQSEERQCYWISPLKTGLSKNAFDKLVYSIWETNSWQDINHRSLKEINDKKEPPLKMFETSWIIKEVIKPDLLPGQKRRPKGSIQHTEISVRCVIYYHKINAEIQKAKRERKRQELEAQLRAFQNKLNNGNLKTVKNCEKSIKSMLKDYILVKPYVFVKFSTDQDNEVIMTWDWDEESFTLREKLDGVFALLTNYKKENISANKLIEKYRDRNQVEISFKDLKGLLDLERIFIQIPERIEAYAFLKVLAYFVLAFLRWYAKEKGNIKTTEKKIQKALGEMLLVSNIIEPINIPVYSLGNDSTLSEWFRTSLGLPDPTQMINDLNTETLVRVDKQIDLWYKSWLIQKTDTKAE